MYSYTTPVVLLLACSSSIVVAQTRRNTCYVTLDTTVPKFCYTTLQNRFPQRKLNFTLVNGPSNRVTLEFKPLPENHQVELEVVDSSDGLKAWASLANSFVDSVRSGSLPYDTILPYLNNSVDSPIVSECPSTSTRRPTGTGDVDINDLLDDFGGWWAPIIVVAALGPLFAIIFVIVGCIFCCCRLCGRCGGGLQQDYSANMDIICTVLYILLLCCVGLLFVGTVFAFISNEKLNDSIQHFNNTVNTAIDHSLDFVLDTQTEANTTVDRYDEVNAFVQCEINNTHISIGGVVIEVFENAVNPLINSSIHLADELNSSIDGLMQVNATVGRLVTLTQRLRTELDNLTDQVEQLRSGCNAASLAVCNRIPMIRYTVNVNYDVVDDVSNVLDQLQSVSNIKALAMKANDTFYGIPCQIRDQISNQTKDILNQANDFRQQIFDITIDIEREINDILDENGFVGDIRTQASDVQQTLDTYDTPRYIVSIVICSLTLCIIVILILGLILGACGYKRDQDPQDRSGLSNCGGIILLIGVGLMFGFAVILLILSSFTFFMGSGLLKVCYSVAEDPPNDLPSYELFTQVVDNRDLWGGYLLGCYILEDSRVPLKVTNMLNGCKKDGALYQVAMLSRRPELNLQSITNITNQIPDLDDLFDQLQQQISFSPDQILTEDTRSSLKQYSNSGLQSIDYLGYIDEINTEISNLNVIGLIAAMRGVRVAFDRDDLPVLVTQTDAIINTTLRINSTSLTEIRNLTDTLEVQIIALNTTASQLNQSVEAVLEAANRATTQLLGENGTDIVINQSRAVLDRVIAYANSYANWAIDNLENQIGRCRPLYATYSNLYFDVCEDAVDGINGFWLAIGWCVLFFIPTIIFAVWLSHYFRKMTQYSPRYNLEDSGSSGQYHRLREMRK